MERDLSWWRSKIDGVDRELLSLLAKREKIAKNIAKVKMLNGIDVFDSQREEKVICARQRQASKFGLKRNFVSSLMRLLMEYSKEAQKEVIYSQKV